MVFTSFSMHYYITLITGQISFTITMILFDCLHEELPW
jgi:hypothetical protein